MSNPAAAGRRLHAIVLAAGTGSRFGGRKLLASWRGGALVDGALRSAFAAPAETVVLVTGAEAAEVEAAGRSFAARVGEERLRVIHAPDHREGMAASLRAGIAALPGTADGAFVFLGDMPAVPATVATRLAGALGDPEVLAAVPEFRGRRGHPVLWARAAFPRLLALRGDVGGRALLGGEAIARVACDDPGILYDVDEPADLARGTGDRTA